MFDELVDDRARARLRRLDEEAVEDLADAFVDWLEQWLDRELPPE